MKQIQQEFNPAVPLNTLSDHPENPRRGDDRAVGDSVTANGFYGAVLVQKSTGRIIGGHTRVRVARELGAATIPAIVLDVDDQQARRILLADNRTSDLAYYDETQLFKTLAAVLDDGGSLTGTGYDDTTYKMLMASPEPVIEHQLEKGNVTQSMTPGDRAAIYEASDIRSLILPYSTDVFNEVLDRLSRLRDALEVDTNAAAMLTILREATDTE